MVGGARSRWAARSSCSSAPGPRARRQYARVASEIAQREVRVRCQGRLGRLLDVGIERRHGAVRPERAARPTRRTSRAASAAGCGGSQGDPHSRELDCVRAAVECPDARRSTPSQAVHTLAHEAVHLAGVRNEAEAECYGLQTSTSSRVRLGADRRRRARSPTTRSRGSIPRSRRTTGRTSAATAARSTSCRAAPTSPRGRSSGCRRSRRRRSAARLVDGLGRGRRHLRARLAEADAVLLEAEGRVAAALPAAVDDATRSSGRRPSRPASARS